MTTYLEELRERYIGVCDGNAEIIGNQLFIYDYNKDCMSSRLNEDLLMKQPISLLALQIIMM